VSTLCDCLAVALRVKEGEEKRPIQSGRLSVPIIFENRITCLATSILDNQIKMAFKCIATVEDGVDGAWNVSFNGYVYEVTDEVSNFVCSCNFPERMGLPCCHVLSVMMANQCLTDIGRYIDTYWSIDSSMCRLQGSQKETITKEIPSEQDLTQELFPEDVEYADLINLVKKLFSFKKDGDLMTSLSVVRHVVENEVGRLKKSKRKARETMHDSSAGIVSPPREKVSSGHPTKRRKIGADELHQRACRRTYGDDFVSSMND